MKKIPTALTLLTLLASGVIATPSLSAKRHSYADPMRVKALQKPWRAKSTHERQVPHKADALQIVYGYCGDPLQSVGTSWTEYTMLVEFPEEFVKRFNGATIKGVQIGSPDNYVDPSVNNFTDIELCFYRDLGGEPFYSQPATLSSKGLDWKEIPLDTPMTIEEGKPFYVGYSGLAPSEDDACFAVDLNYNSDDLGLWLGWVDEETGKEIWESYTEWYGNMCLRLVIEGDNLPTDEMTLEWVYPPAYSLTGKPFEVTATIHNTAANDISSIGLDYKVGTDSGSINLDIDPPVAFNETRDIAIPGIICNTSGNRIPLSIDIKSVNGNEEALVTDITEGDTYIYSIPEGVGYSRNVVIEEGTGTWCGYCPMGIVAMEYMNEKYKDNSFIPITIHYNDEMAAETYNPIAETYFEVYPSSLINRDTYRFGIVTPYTELLDFAYNYAKEIPALAEITLDADYTDESRSAIEITTSTNFAMQTDDSYSVAFALTEHNVGPYMQLNYFADYAEGEMGGFESLPEYVELTYNDVARGYYVGGEIGNVPGENHKLSFTLPLDDLSDKENFNLVAMVINNTTGEIENAAMLKSTQMSGVDEIEPAESPLVFAANGEIFVSGTVSKVTVFTADGKTVGSFTGEGCISVAPGLYIVKVGDKSSKVFCR